MCKSLNVQSNVPFRQKSYNEFSSSIIDATAMQMHHLKHVQSVQADSRQVGEGCSHQLTFEPPLVTNLNLAHIKIAVANSSSQKLVTSTLIPISCTCEQLIPAVVQTMSVQARNTAI